MNLTGAQIHFAVQHSYGPPCYVLPGQTIGPDQDGTGTAVRSALGSGRGDPGARTQAGRQLEEPVRAAKEQVGVFLKAL